MYTSTNGNSAESVDFVMILRNLNVSVRNIALFGKKGKSKESDMGAGMLHETCTQDEPLVDEVA